jgi:hypothetical protein
MPEFTPSPWTLARNGDLLGPDGEKLLLTGVRLLMNGTPAEVAEAQANTRLLAAAPDLLEALEFLIPAAEECMLLTGNGALSEDDEVILDIARAAVAQAKGGTPC